MTRSPCRFSDGAVDLEACDETSGERCGDERPDAVTRMGRESRAKGSGAGPVEVLEELRAVSPECLGVGGKEGTERCWPSLEVSILDFGVRSYSCEKGKVWIWNSGLENEEWGMGRDTQFLNVALGKDTREYLGHIVGDFVDSRSPAALAPLARTLGAFCAALGAGNRCLALLLERKGERW